MNCSGSWYPFLPGRLWNDLTCVREGVADEELAKKEAERGRKRKIEDGHANGSRKRSRSMSSYSSTSVSTISTTISRSQSPAGTGKGHTGQSQRMSELEMERKRRRSSSSMSYSSNSSRDRVRRHNSSEGGTRRRKQGQPIDRTSRRHHRSRSLSSSRMFPGERRKESLNLDRSKRRRHASRSPQDRGRHRSSHPPWTHRHTKSSSDSRDRSEMVRNRKSMTPSISWRPPEMSERRPGRPSFDRHSTSKSSYSDDHDRYGSSARTLNGNSSKNGFSPERIPPRQRSLSPFSKRLALTQAMNMGQ